MPSERRAEPDDVLANGTGRFPVLEAGGCIALRFSRGGGAACLAEAEVVAAR